jgi:DNA-binding CsgD family transcriptional regulator
MIIDYTISQHRKDVFFYLGSNLYKYLFVFMR